MSLTPLMLMIDKVRCRELPSIAGNENGIEADLFDSTRLVERTLPVLSDGQRFLSIFLRN